MSPSNLGIVFGPTLLRPLVSTDMSMIALLETTYQAVLVEFLITHHDKIFGLEQGSDTPPPPPPTAPLPDTPPRGSCPLDGVAYLDSENETTSRERPRSVEVSISVRFKHLWLIFNCSLLSSSCLAFTPCESKHTYQFFKSLNTCHLNLTFFPSGLTRSSRTLLHFSCPLHSGLHDRLSSFYFLLYTALSCKKRFLKFT